MEGKVKNTALDFTVPTAGADLCFHGPSATKSNGDYGASHPMLSDNLPIYLPLNSPGTHLELGRL